MLLKQKNTKSYGILNIKIIAAREFLCFVLLWQKGLFKA